ncbi:hypothetical protein [Siccirubricoccus phaeus]|uniref:hypothetical protein n=1 Tax=Siccirubricoccus phaeus TaxID=2595053 RepID=UPI0011F1E070|nr:hypothetical protein [Siccirubricoccus phaeus]
MRQEAVALSYLEWVRLIGTGAIRLAEARIVRWRPDRADPAEVVANLMLGAPDLGTSATSFVLAMLEPEVLDRMREGGIDLGQRLNLETVRSFHSFSDTALAVHRPDAEAAGVFIDLTPLAAGWAGWAAAVEAADRRAKGEALLALLGVPPCDRFGQATDRLADRERCIVPNDIVRARDSMFFGWACVLNAEKVRTGVAPILPADVKDEADALRRDFDVDQPFLARAPRLRAFVATLAAEGDRPSDLLAMASLKQHERYVIKREGAALDLPSLLDDIRILEGLDAGAAGFLVQSLGERVPSELIRALKVRCATCAVAPTAVPTSAGDDAARVPDQDDCADVVPTINPHPPTPIEGATPPLERPMLPEATSEQSAGAGVVTSVFVSAEASTFVPSDAVTEPLQEDEAPLNAARRRRSASAPDLLGYPLPPCPVSPEAESSAEAASSRGPEDRQRADVATRSRSRAGKSAPKTKKPKSQRDQLTDPIKGF